MYNYYFGFFLINKVNFRQFEVFAPQIGNRRYVTFFQSFDSRITAMMHEEICINPSSKMLKMLHETKKKTHH